MTATTARHLFLATPQLATPLLTALALSSATGHALAEAPTSDAPKRPAPGSAHGPAQLDIELDPIAYAAKGFSVHGGLRYRRLRFDVGAFGLEVPEFIHGNSAFDSRFAGYGIKLDYRFKDAGDGLFVGISAGRVLQTVTHHESAITTTQYLHDLSGRVGYEISVASGFYVAPWVSVGHMFGSKEIQVQDDTFNKEPPVSIFPTIHLGFRL